MSQLPPAAWAPDPLIGLVLDGRYRIESLVARGGMATVYRGADLRLERSVAVKVMHPSFATDPGFVARFEREARAAARLNSPYAVAVNDQGTDQGVTYLVMEYVPGHTVRDLLRVHGVLEPAAALAIIDPVLEALAAAHRAGYIHRDVKPENVLISDDGRVKVTDFGLARAIESSDSGKTHGLLLGTVAYLSPEQVDQARTDARSDVYSAGILLFEMLTGAVPFSGAAPLQVAYKHVHEDVPTPSRLRPDLPAGLAEIVVRATRRRPDQRYPDADAFLTDVRRIRAVLPPVPAWKPSPTDTLVVPPTGDPPPRRATASAGGPIVAAAPVAAAPVAAAPVAQPVAAAPAASASVPATAAAASIPPSPEKPTPEALAGAGSRPPGVELSSAPGPEPTPDPAVAGPVIDLTEQQKAPQQLPFITTANRATHPDVVAGPAAAATSKRNTRGRMLVGVLALVCVVGLLAFLFGPLRQVTVPQISGHSVQEATAMLAAANLRLDADGRDYSETVPKGQIITSNPEGGKSTRTGSTVVAVVSRGPERYDVPDLRGVTAAEAEVALKATKLTSGRITQDYHDTVDEGDVIRTDPTRGTSVKPNTAVNLTISKGPEPVPLPKLEGTSAVQASKTLRDLGLKVSITKQISESVPKGNVVSMSPKGGTTVDHGSTVKIVESKGPPMVTVPDVVGKNRAEATAALEAVGFAVDVDYPLIFGTFDRVHSQSPQAGTSAPKGSTVTIDVV